MLSLHKAARDGELDECRRLVEKEGKDVNEKNEVNICMISSTCINQLKLANISFHSYCVFLMDATVTGIEKKEVKCDEVCKEAEDCCTAEGFDNPENKK
jgi:hypothetical protein